MRVYSGIICFVFGTVRLSIELNLLPLEWHRMRIATGMPIVLGLVIAITGCKSPLTNDAEPTDRFADVKEELPPQQPARHGVFASVSDQTNSGEDPHESASTFVGDDQPINLVSAIDVVQVEPIRTLQVGEDLGTFVDGAPGVVLLDFYAEWCGPCKKQAVILHELQDKVRSAQAQVIKVDFDEHGDLAKRFNVKTLPTLVVIKDGQVQQKKVGLTDQKQILAMLN
jgi:thioredoxin